MSTPDLEQRIRDCERRLAAWCEAHGRTVTADGSVFEDVAAELLVRSPGTLKNWRAGRTGPPWHRTGGRGRVRYRLADLAAFLEDGRITPGHE